jgi:sec-independent protein translocase protein TatC
MSQPNNTFWDHLEVLRAAVLRSLAVVCAMAVVAFLLKDFVFETIVFGPTRYDFPTFRFFSLITSILPEGVSVDTSIHPVKIISTRLSAQLLTHLSVSFWAGVIVSVPYITGELWFFVKPALYQGERKNILKSLMYSSILFYMGVLTAYYLILPLSVNFLGNYHVSPDIDNLISIDSYFDTLVTLCLSTGISFELPIVTYFLAKVGIVSHTFMRTHRKHAFLLVLVLAAMITPSTDIFTMFLTALPLQIVYEIGVATAKAAERVSAMPIQK